MHISIGKKVKKAFAVLLAVIFVVTSFPSPEVVK